MNKRHWLMGYTALVVVLVSGCASMAPANSTLADTLSTQPQLTTLNRLVRQAGLADMLGSEGPYTILAPSDEAFKAVPPRTLDELGHDPVRLKAVLSYHILASRLASDAIQNGKLKTLEGSELAASRAGTFVTIEDAMVTQADVGARNGVIHVIDRVLTPPKR